MKKRLRIGIIQSRYHRQVCEGLLWGVNHELGLAGATITQTIEAPGAFEIPLLAKSLAESGTVDGIITVGCVIKGDTFHFELIAGAASLGIMQASLETGIPIAMGILTTYTEEQAVLRSQKNLDSDNKGREAAKAVLGSITQLAELVAKAED